MPEKELMDNSQAQKDSKSEDMLDASPGTVNFQQFFTTTKFGLKSLVSIDMPMAASSKVEGAASSKVNREMENSGSESGDSSVWISSDEEYSTSTSDTDLTEDHQTKASTGVGTQTRYPCPIKGCNQEFKSKISVSIHSRSRHPSSGAQGRPHPCQVEGCERVFFRPGRLQEHIKKVHSGGVKEFKCTEGGCSRSYFTASHLNRHMITHLPHANFLCARCELDNNPKRKQRDKVTKYREEYCDRRFATRVCSKCSKGVYFERNKPKPAKNRNPITLCHVCGQCFENARDYVRHARGHVVYECPYVDCKNREFSYNEMRTHLVSCTKHPTGYYCDTCNKRFSSKTILATHLATHQEDRQVYHCPVKGCVKHYLYMRNLTQHINVTHGNKRFSCQYCPEDLSTKQKLTQHVKRYHKSEKKSKLKNMTTVRKGPKTRKPTMVHIMLGVRVLAEAKKKKQKKVAKQIDSE